MKILVVGLGSVGQRHALNLLKLGYDNLVFVTPNKKKITNKKLRKIKTFSNLDTALLERPKAAIICTPTQMHENIALKLSKFGVHFLLEKPVGTNRKKIIELIKICKKKNIINMIGYMMRFHPAVIKLKKLLAKNGPFFYFNSEWGEYLPNWNKYTKKNYKINYAANNIMGGGVALTLSHDLDLSRFLFGEIKNSEIKVNKINPLKIKSNSVVDFYVTFKNKISGNIHLDYLQKNKTRIWNIVGMNTRITFNYYINQILVQKVKNKEIYNFKSFNRNQLFIDEIKYFLNCVKGKKKTICNVENSYKTLDQFNLI